GSCRVQAHDTLELSRRNLAAYERVAWRRRGEPAHERPAPLHPGAQTETRRRLRQPRKLPVRRRVRANRDRARAFDRTMFCQSRRQRDFVLRARDAVRLRASERLLADRRFPFTCWGSFFAPVSRFHSSNVSAEILPSTSN